jgi:hypothetical protein
MRQAFALEILTLSLHIEFTEPSAIGHRHLRVFNESMMVGEFLLVRDPFLCFLFRLT